MEDTRLVLEKVHALMPLATCWSVEECDPTVKRVLAAVRKLCHGDEDVVRANLLAALIRSFEMELNDQEKTALKRLRAGTAS